MKEEEEVIQKIDKSAKPDSQYNKISTYNGGVTDKYSWSQTINEVTVEIPLVNKTKAKNVGRLPGFGEWGGYSVVECEAGDEEGEYR